MVVSLFISDWGEVASEHAGRRGRMEGRFSRDGMTTMAVGKCALRPFLVTPVRRFLVRQKVVGRDGGGRRMTPSLKPLAVL